MYSKFVEGLFNLSIRSYSPYKYDLNRFTILNTTNKEQVDPTVNTVLMARSKVQGVSLTEFAVFLPKWAMSQDTFRPPVSQAYLSGDICVLTCPFSTITATWPPNSAV